MKKRMQYICEMHAHFPMFYQCTPFTSADMCHTPDTFIGTLFTRTCASPPCFLGSAISPSDLGPTY